MASPLIDAARLWERLDDPLLRVVDTRWYLADPTEGRAEYRRHHIPGAIFLDIDDDLSGTGGPGRHPLPDWAVFADLLGSKGIGTTHHVVVYDDSAGSVAARLWWMLRHLGHEAVSVLDGGYGAWRLAGYPTEAAPPEWPARRFGYQIRAGDLVERDELLARLGSVILLDARAPERYEGAEDPVDPIPGHIPTALSAPYAAYAARDGRFLPARDLRRRLRSLGVGGRAVSVAYCGSGVTSCTTILAAVAAGLPEPLLYPGSWSDWCTAGMPIATGPEPGMVPPPQTPA